MTDIQLYIARLPAPVRLWAWDCWDGTADSVCFAGLIPSEMAAIKGAVEEIKSLSMWRETSTEQ